MKRLPYILLILLCYLIFCGKSCVDEEAETAWQQTQAEKAKDTIQHEFETDYLSEEARHGAEVNAAQKLKDLADYVEIFSDHSLESEFRKKAGEMVSKMFVSPGNKLSFGPVRNEKMKQETLKEFLKDGFGENYSKTEVIFDSIRVQKPLQEYDGSTYSGELAAYQTISLHSLADSSISSANKFTIHFISSKQVKIIGKDTLKVWEVKLGDLEVVKY